MKGYFGSFLATILLIVIAGCGTAPRPTPVATIAPVIITQIVTATPPPVTDTPAPPAGSGATLTAAAAITTTQTSVALARPTNTTAPARSSTPTRRPVTATPTKVVTAAPTGIPSIAKYKDAVNLRSPIYAGNDPGDQRDVRQAPSDALVFEWQSNQALGTGECYLIRVDLKSNADGSTRGDAFMQCDSTQTQKQPAQTVQFILNKPNFTPGPTYAGLIPSGGGDISVTWNVTIVRDDGPASSGGSYFAVDGSRHNITLLGPVSKTVYFILKGAP